jgi:hypothetical protein
MKTQSVVKLFATTAIAATLVAVNSIVTFSQTTPKEQAQSKEEINFVCDSSSDLPKTLAVSKDKQGRSTQTPMFTWYSEYATPGESAEALCQKMAQKLQNKYNRGEEVYFSSEPVQAKNPETGAMKMQGWKVCLVPSDGAQGCTGNERAEELFTLNGNYRDPLACVMENTQPDACRPYMTTRGRALAIPAGEYKPGWLSWFF